MQIEKALEIPGWMELEELEWLAFEASRHRVIVEIGSFLGRSSRAIADNTDGVLYCVDNWLGPKEIEPPVYPPEKLYQTFCQNNQDHIESGKIVPIKMDSMLAAKYIPFDFEFDMVFIDGSHDLQSVKDDIEVWAKRTTLGGLFSGHDAQWPGVSEARRLYLPQHMTGVGSIWAVDNFHGLNS